ncbi:PLD nuclease N-terminal domain-containing protein [Gordonia sp. HS-NH1]|uniref:PLD nuclease N-terminal domain-containing protein n=1 Tax=Gordonia sp. HS-NH1 TaxID=1435068 RepID=UPI0006E12777|nr:PLD nuclease N-terminal domain-containing protein [Gordonia sp. HS-NH1]
MPYLGLIYLLILVVALIDIIKTDDAAVRGLPKFAWVVLVVMIPLAGALVWLAVGRPTADERPRRQSAAAGEFPEYDHPSRYIPRDPEADQEFLRQVRERAEQQRRTAREQQRAADRTDRTDDQGLPPTTT